MEQTISDYTSRYFRGPEGYNCAQATFKVLYEMGIIHKHELIDDLRKYGGGRAPDGMCGALFAALTITPAGMHDRIREIFVSRAGSTACRDIRGKGHLSCADCVKTAVSAVLIS